MKQASGPLHLQLPLLGTLFSRLLDVLPHLQLKGYNLREALPDYSISSTQLFPAAFVD